MITIEKAETYGWEAAIRGMRNPMNSWDKDDSYSKSMAFLETYPDFKKDFDGAKDSDGFNFAIGKNNLDLMKRLAAAGHDHRKYLRMITVYVDITAPLYWWKEFDTYKVGTVANSCSTMHKIASKPFAKGDFSHDHLVTDHKLRYSKNFSISPDDWLNLTIDELNYFRELYSNTNDKIYWWQMIQMLPSSYNQKRTVMMNYEMLANAYFSRKNHRLDEWHVFCDWVLTLPYFKDIFEIGD